MPPGTVQPFVMRFDTGSVPVGYLVFKSETRSFGEIQDAALFKVLPMFASISEHRRSRHYATTMLEYARLRAPYDCVVTERHVVTGDFVQLPANGADKPLYVVHRTDLMRVVVQVPENDAEWIRDRISASVRIPKLQNQTFTGPVARIRQTPLPNLPFR